MLGFTCQAFHHPLGFGPACDGVEVAVHVFVPVPSLKPVAQQCRVQPFWSVSPGLYQREAVEFKGRDAIRVTEDPDRKSSNSDRLAIVSETDFQDGIIEVSLSGELSKDAVGAARGFVGIAFRVARDKSQFELIYLRPTNGRADDQLRRNHAT